MKTVLDILKQARILINSPERHCKDHYARTEFDTPTGVEMFNAFKFCGLGAIRKVDGRTGKGTQAALLLRDAAYWLYKMDAADVNDKLGHTAILAVFDEAIKNESERANQAARFSTT